MSSRHFGDIPQFSPAEKDSVMSRRREGYLGEHGQVLVLNDGSPVGCQAALLQTGKKVIEMDTAKKQTHRNVLYLIKFACSLQFRFEYNKKANKKIVKGRGQNDKDSHKISQ